MSRPSGRYPEDRIIEVARSLLASDGKDAAAASSGERIAGALLAGNLDWAGYGHPVDAIGRLGDEWFSIVQRIHTEEDWQSK